jgi:general secretion pathway protein G
MPTVARSIFIAPSSRWMIPSSHVELRISFVIPRCGARWGLAVVCGTFLLAAGCRDPSPQEARELALREALDTFRSTLDQYRGDKGTYPASLNDLVSQGYLRSIPRDPMTRSRETWRITYAYPGTPAPWETSHFVIVRIRSGAEGRARDGTAYSSW